MGNVVCSWRRLQYEQGGNRLPRGSAHESDPAQTEGPKVAAGCCKITFFSTRSTISGRHFVILRMERGTERCVSLKACLAVALAKEG